MKNVLNLGTPLTKEAQKAVLGAYIQADTCKTNADCGSGACVFFERQTGGYPAGKHCL